MENFTIRRDGRLDFVNTLKVRAIPATIKYSQDGHKALDSALSNIKGFSKALNEYTYKIANS